MLIALHLRHWYGFTWYTSSGVTMQRGAQWGTGTIKWAQRPTIGSVPKDLIYTI